MNRNHPCPQGTYKLVADTDKLKGKRLCKFCVKNAVKGKEEWGTPKRGSFLRLGALWQISGKKRCVRRGLNDEWEQAVRGWQGFPGTEKSM